LPTIPPISGKTERYVRWLRRHAWVVVGAAVSLCVASTLLALKLQLRTDLAELLPNGDPGLQELRRMQLRMPSTSALIVNVHSPDRLANVRFADAIAERARKLPSDLVEVAVSSLAAERSWFLAHKWLYPKLADLEVLRDRLRTEIQKRKNPLFVDIDEDAETLEQLKARLTHEGVGSFGSLANERLGDGHLVTQSGDTAMVVLLPPGGIFQENAGERLVERIHRIVAELDPGRAGVQVGLSGDVESNLEERAALENDLVWATSLSVLLVCAVVVLFYGRLRAVPLMAAPALCGSCVAFGIAKLAFGYLNSSTAFLASIIIGNGINFAIIQLARYEEERGIGVVPEVALVRAVAATWRATAIAALGASISYGSLVLTRFRGFSQFGVIGGAGMVLAWVATMTVLPAVIWLLDRKGRREVGRSGRRGPLFASGVARLATRAPRTLIGAGCLITLAAGLLLPRYLRDPFEYNFRNLRSARSESNRGEGRWEKSNREVFGESLTPIVFLTDRVEQIEQTRRALRAADERVGGGPLIDRMVALADFVPGTAVEQEQKIAVLEEIRRLGRDPSFELLDEDERARLAAYIPPARLTVLAAGDLPPLVRRPFTERDGSSGRVLLVFPARDRYASWNGRDLMRMAERVGEVRLESGEVVRSAGKAVVFAGMLRSIVHDGPRATLASALGVMLLVVALARGISGAALVLATLLAGLLWMIGGAAAVDLRINFLNFVAIPVTLGIGVDYGINIYLRYRLEGPGRLYAAVRATGGAVALCSATTIIGYGALLVADNRGLRSFGALAILGEIACLAAALIFMPALLALRERRLGLARRLEAEGASATVKHVRAHRADLRPPPAEGSPGAAERHEAVKSKQAP
jgi:predicted RND superfamily exporter protein